MWWASYAFAQHNLEANLFWQVPKPRIASFSSVIPI